MMRLLRLGLTLQAISSTPPWDGGGVAVMASVRAFVAILACHSPVCQPQILRWRRRMSAPPAGICGSSAGRSQRDRSHPLRRRVDSGDEAALFHALKARPSPATGISRTPTRIPTYHAASPSTSGLMDDHPDGECYYSTQHLPAARLAAGDGTGLGSHSPRRRYRYLRPAPRLPAGGGTARSSTV